MRNKLLFFVCIFSIFFISTQAQNQDQKERITNFNVEVVLLEDRSIEVTEHIEVYSKMKHIRRGITRGLPTTREVDGRKFDVKFNNLEVSRDGKPEAFHTQDISDGKMLYIGRREVFLKEGPYTYEIKYTVPNQTMYGEDTDQLLWNAIGLDVAFPSDKANVKIHLPKGAKLRNAKSYIGKFGSSENQSRVHQTVNGSIVEFNINEGLKAYEAVTTDIELEKGSINKPSILEKSGSGIALLLASLLMLGYFLFTWFKYGRDPESLESALLYDTPENLSPASISYINEERYRDRSLTSSMISLAVKGYINISKEPGMKTFFGVEESYVIRKLQEGSEELPPEELAIMNHLFRGRNVINLDGDYQESVKDCIREHKRAVLAQHKVFVKEGSNLKFIVLPILITIFAAVLSILLNNWFGLGSQQYLINLSIFVPLALIGIFVYRYLIIQPTVEKLNLQSEIRGFKEYLRTNLTDRQNLSGAPEMSAAHFENLLPHAFALDVETNWSSTFEKKLKDAQYQPSWSNGHYIYGSNFHYLFSRTMSRSGYKEPPASSGGGGFSGGGGGGFSGGGGGGGSVGGW